MHNLQADKREKCTMKENEKKKNKNFFKRMDRINFVYFLKIMAKPKKMVSIIFMYSFYHFQSITI